MKRRAARCDLGRLDAIAIAAVASTTTAASGSARVVRWLARTGATLRLGVEAPLVDVSEDRRARVNLEQDAVGFTALSGLVQATVTAFIQADQIRQVKPEPLDSLFKRRVNQLLKTIAGLRIEPAVTDNHR